MTDKTDNREKTASPTSVPHKEKKEISIGDKLNLLHCHLYNLNSDLYKYLDLPSLMNLDIIAKQFETEIKILITQAIAGNQEKFDQSQGVLKTEVPTIIHNLIASGKTMLDQQREKIAQELAAKEKVSDDEHEDAIKT